MYSKRSLGSREPSFQDVDTGRAALCPATASDESGTSARQRQRDCSGRRLTGPRSESGEMGPKMTIDTRPAGRRARGASGAVPGEGSATRRRILQIALTLMAQRGVDGTSMRDLASAAGPQRGLAVPLLPEQAGPPGVGPDRAGLPPHPAGAHRSRGRDPAAEPPHPGPAPGRDHDLHVRGRGLRPPDGGRGHAGRGDGPRRGCRPLRLVRISIEDWVKDNRPDLDEGPGAAAVARLLSAMVVGIFIQHAADVLGEEGDDLTALSLDRAREAASILRPPE